MLSREQEKRIKVILLALFFASLTTVVSSLSLRFYSDNLIGYVVIALSLVINILIFFFSYLKYGGKRTALTVLAYSIFVYLVFISRYFSSIVLSMLFFTLSIIWSIEIDENSLRNALKKLGIRGEKSVKNLVWNVFSTLLIVYVILLIEAIIFFVAGVKDAGVVNVVGELPLYLVVFSFTIAPIFEEVFFRGFLMQKIGIILSSLLFAVAHVGYGSFFELIGAFTVGIVFSLTYKRTKSLMTTIISHMAVNLITNLAVYYLKSRGMSI